MNTNETLRSAAQAMLDEYRTVMNSAYCQCDEAEDVTSNLIKALAAVDLPSSPIPTNDQVYAEVCRQRDLVSGNYYVSAEAVNDTMAAVRSLHQVGSTCGEVK